MDYENLLAMLDIETPAELVYFEQFADLMEHEADIPQAALARLAEGMEPDVLAELIDGYFDDVLKSVPDGESDLYTLLSNIGTTLGTLAGGENEGAGAAFAEELHRFRAWYTADSRVLCRETEEGTEREVPLLEALTSYRVQNFTDEDYEYDFADALDYPLDEYIMSVNALLENDYDEEYDDYESGYKNDHSYRDIDDD